MACYKLNWLILLVFAWLVQSSFIPFHFLAHGRRNPGITDVIEATNQEAAVKDRSLIGSSPPRCFERCKNCGHCEAIQVPVVPARKAAASKSSSSKIETAYYRSDNYNSNYKPMCWKCKCGDLIFNP